MDPWSNLLLFWLFFPTYRKLERLSKMEIGWDWYIHSICANINKLGIDQLTRADACLQKGTRKGPETERVAAAQLQMSPPPPPRCGKWIAGRVCIKLTGAKRREFSGMIHWLTVNFIIPATLSNPSIPYVKRTSKRSEIKAWNWRPEWPEWLMKVGISEFHTVKPAESIDCWKSSLTHLMNHTHMLHVWNIYLQNWLIFVVKCRDSYSSTMVRIWVMDHSDDPQK